MKQFCPACGKESEWDSYLRQEVFNIRGEEIPVEVEVFRCPLCKEEFEDLKAKKDPYKDAYDIFRSFKGFLRPEEILSFRKKYDLTQKEFGKILGFGEVTLSRYENGALQDEVHDRLLREMMKPLNILDYVNKNPQVISTKKRDSLIARLLKDCNNTFLLTYLQNQEPSSINGQKAFNFSKVVNMLKLLVHENGVYKSKLLKLFFYSDFYHHKACGFSISGMKYAHATFGPVPDKFELILAMVLEQDPSVEISSTDYGELYTATTSFDSTCLTLDEITSLTSVNKYFKKFDVKAIEEFSHLEPGWIQTPNGKLISYSFSKNLRI